MPDKFKMNGRAEYFDIHRNGLVHSAVLAMHAAGLDFTAESPNESTFSTIVKTLYKMGVHDGYEKGYRAGICDWVGHNEGCATTQLQSDLLDALQEFREGDAAREIQETEWMETLCFGLPENIDADAVQRLSKKWNIPIDQVVRILDDNSAVDDEA